MRGAQSAYVMPVWQGGTRQVESRVLVFIGADPHRARIGGIRRVRHQPARLDESPVRFEALHSHHGIVKRTSRPCGDIDRGFPD